jgi:hypothetical protein
VEGESVTGKSEDGENDSVSAIADEPARRFFCVVAGELDARSKKKAATQVPRNARTPNGKQTFL